MAFLSSFAAPSPSQKQSFTLLELLLVIAILSLLAGLLLPALPAAREKGIGINCLANIKQITSVYLLYSNDFEAYLPCRDNIGGGTNSYGESVSAKNWLDDLMRDYIGKNQVSTEPAKLLFCPHETGTTDITTNYGLNYLIATKNGRGIKTTRFRNAPQTSMIVENYGHLCYYCYARNESGSHAFGIAYASNRAPFFRHRSRCTASFLDGHASALEKLSIPCRESYLNADENTLKNTFFNTGKVDPAHSTVNGL